MNKLKLAGLTALAAALLMGMASPSWALFDKELDNEKLAVNFYNEVQRGAYKVVDTAELKKWMDEKKPMLVIDTMPFEASYKKEHVPGAAQMEFPIPELTALEAKQQADLQKLLGPDKDRLIVFYCGFPKCTRSHNGAMWAVKLGYKNVYRYPGGIKAWAEAGYPVEKVQ